MTIPTGRAERSSPSAILLVLAVAGVAYAILQAAVAPALPTLQRELDTSLSGATWVLTSILLSASVCTPVLGKMGDLYGKKRMLVIVLGIFAFGTAVSAVSTALPLMLVGRVLQGVGGGIFPLAFGIIRDEMPRERVAGSIGILSATLGIGGGFGIVVSGLIVKYLDYHFLFWFPLIPILFATAAAWIYIPDSGLRKPGSINWPGAILLGIGLTAFLLTVTQGRTWGWGSAPTIGCLLLAIGALISWVLVERRAAEPLVDMQIMTLRGVWTANLVALIVGFGMFGSFTLTAQFLQMPVSSGYGFGKDVLEAGLFLLPSSIMMLLTGLFTGPLERRFGSRPLIIFGTVVGIIGFAMLAVAHTASWHFLLSGAILGLGMGLCFASLAGVVVLAVPQNQVGAATGMNTIMRTIGSSLGSAVPGTILASFLIAGTSMPTENAFTFVFWLMAGSMVIGTLAALLIPGRRVAPVGQHIVAPSPAASTVE